MKPILSALAIILITLSNPSVGVAAKLADEWSWIREDPAGWRSDGDVFELRAQKGRLWSGNDAKNILVHKRPADSARASVDVDLGSPENLYEQGGLLVYRDDDHFVKLIVEHIGGEFFIVMAREVGGKGKVFTKIKTGEKAAGLRLGVEGDRVTASYRIGRNRAWLPAGECELPGAADARFAMFTQDGSDTDERWVTFSGFDIEPGGALRRAELEGEALQVLQKTGSVKPQGMGGFGAGVWSGDAQLWWTGGKPGDVLELAVPVADGGYYQLGAAMTKAVDYGVFELSLDGQVLGAQVDFFQPIGVAHSGLIQLGGMELEAGQHTFAAKIVGANPEAVKAYMFGLDYLRLQKVDAEPEAIFDGETLRAWDGDEKWWRVEDGAIVGEIPAGGGLADNQFLFWDGELHDFELRLKFRISGDKSANSGVQFRSLRAAEGHAVGYQADIDDGTTWTGRIYDEHARGLLGERGAKVTINAAGGSEQQKLREPGEFAALVKQAPEWNEYVIRAVGPHLQTTINGELCADVTDGQIGQQDFSGKLAVQLHAGPGPVKVEFKDIVLTSLGETEASKTPSDPNGSRPGISPADKNLGFEDGTLRGWAATGDAWEGMPIEGDTISVRRPGQASHHDGKFWVGGYERNHTDAGQGTLISEPFEVTRPWASFLVGGGVGEGTRVDLIDAASGGVIFSASSSREGLEDMEPVAADLSAYLGRQIRIRIVDESAGPWGHINYDDFRFHERKPINRPGRLATNPILKHLVPNPVGEGAEPTVAGMWVPEGFEVELIAKEPDVTQPIAFTFDERGRLWVAEAHSYPRRQPEGQGRDRIVIFEDADGDGRFEKKTTFATGLNLVSGLEVGFGGVWVGAAPQFLFIPDADRDDRPDGDPVVLLDGWGLQDTHETLNSFTWGPDGWLYGNQGVFNLSKVGKPGTPEEARTQMRAGVWRYHPQRQQFEIFATGCSNQWGIDFNEVGQMFITHCRSAWGGGPTTYVVQGGHYWNQANSNHAPFISGGQAGWNPGSEQVFRNYLPSSAGYGHGEGGAGKPGSRAIYGGHAHVGTMIYLGGNWPAEFRDQLFTHNLHGHQMNRQINRRKGSGYETVHSGADQLLTPDPRFIGVDLKYGPDGAVYMIDWYDKQHCHTNDTEAWDRSDGRIYRMAWAETYRPVKVDLSEKTSAELVRLVTSEDEWYSRMARRLLQERHGGGAQGLSDGDRAGLVGLLGPGGAGARDALRAMWTLEATGMETSQLAIKHADENVRAWAIRLRSEESLPAAQLVELARTDPSAMVRLALASALPTVADDEIRWALAETLAAKPEDSADTYLPKMVWYGIAPLVYDAPARAMRMAGSTPMPMLADSVAWYLSRDAAGREQLAKRLAKSGAADADHLLNMMAFSLPSAGKFPAPPGWAGLATKLRNPASAPALDKLGGLFGDASVLAAMRKTVSDKTAPAERRQEAFEFLRATGDTECASEFVALLGEPAFRSAVLPLLGRFDEAPVAAAILTYLPSLDGADRNAALGALSSKPELAVALLSAVSDGRVEKSLLTSLHIRQMQALGDQLVTDLITGVWGRLNESSATAKASVARYKKLYSEAPLWSFDREAGAAVFGKTCATCHQIGGEGIALGPDLSGSYTNGLDYFLENVIDPNAVIGENFQLNIITRNDGSIISGMPANETADVLTIRTLSESIDIPKPQIKSRQVLEQSMMPTGLLDTLAEKEVIELLKFLTTK